MPIAVGYLPTRRVRTSKDGAVFQSIRIALWRIERGAKIVVIVARAPRLIVARI